MRITLRDLKILTQEEGDEFVLEVVDPIIGQSREITRVKRLVKLNGQSVLEIHLNKPNVPRARRIKPEGGPGNGQENS